MIDGEYLALRPEFIYLERTDGGIGNIRYCFFPFQASDWDKQMKELMKFVINEMDYREKQAVNPVYELFEEASREMIDLAEMKKTAGLLRREASEEERAGDGKEADKGEDKEDGAAGSGQGIRETDKAELAERAEQDRKEKAYPVVLRSEDVLWMDGFGKYETEKRKGQRRRSRDGSHGERSHGERREMTLPGSRKKSILEVIGRRQRE